MEAIEKFTRYRVVRGDAQHRAALEEAKRDGFMWVSTSRVPTGRPAPDDFIAGCYRMKFERKDSK